MLPIPFSSNKKQKEAAIASARLANTLEYQSGKGGSWIDGGWELLEWAKFKSNMDFYAFYRN